MTIKDIGRRECSETGIIVALIFIATGLIQDSESYYKMGFVILLCVLLCPMLFKPLALLWFTLALWMSKVSTPIILAMVYVIVLMPVALLMRLWGKDTLRLKQFKKENFSVFNHRGYRYTEKDILKPY